MELLHSSGIDPAHPRHMHESFAIGIVERGVVVNQSRGETTYLPRQPLYLLATALSRGVLELTLLYGIVASLGFGARPALLPASP